MSKFLENKLVNLNNENYSRKKKLNKLLKLGFNFPNNFRKNAISDNLKNLYEKKNKDELKKLNIEVSIAGRMITKRIIGKAAFVNLQDVGGNIQLYISYNKFTNENYKKILKDLDIGDIIGAIGKLFKTNTGELSVYCNKIMLLTKSIRTLPNKFHGLNDPEIRYRKRYLDLISNSKSREIFKIRSRIITEIRNFMISNNFIEVETPMMQPIPGGASARPFITHHNALNIKMYLRISPELYLKRLIIGGFERVFEINRNFRNEGLSSVHNPEFTMMELYMAYADYYDLINFVENLFRTITKIVLGSCIVNYGKYTFDFSKPFKRMTMKEAILTYNKNLYKKDFDKISYANKIAKLYGINVKTHWELGKIQSEIFKKTTEHHLIQPTFITAYPLEISPLARINNKNKFVTDRLELFIGGREIGNGFSELNDPEEQKIRFYDQIKKNNEKNNKFIFNDKDYIIALEYGLPPTAGLGIGIDRMIMFLTNSDSIKDVILFPTLRPKNILN